MILYTQRSLQEEDCVQLFIVVVVFHPWIPKLFRLTACPAMVPIVRAIYSFQLFSVAGADQYFLIIFESWTEIIMANKKLQEMKLHQLYLVLQGKANRNLISFSMSRK